MFQRVARIFTFKKQGVKMSFAHQPHHDLNKFDKIKIFFLAGFLYLLFIAGGLFPISLVEFNKSIGKALALVIFMILLVTSKIKIKKRDAVVLFIFFVCTAVFGAVGILRSDHIGYAFEKLDGAVILTLVITILIYLVVIRYNETILYKYFLSWFLIILFATLIYKLQFGFFDREINFFLNGPIVYGWMMGFGGIVSFHLFKVTRSRVYLFFILIFIVALFWTQSKGPIIAFAVGFFLYLWMSSTWRFRLLILGVFFGMSILLMVFFADIEGMDNSRLSAIARIFQQSSPDTDEGSIGIRWVLIEEAFRNFMDSPLIGSGLGNFIFDEHLYPHNQHLEILSELGIFAACLHVIFITVALIKANNLNKSLMFFFIIGASFSGNISYLRFIYPFALLSIINARSRVNCYSSRF